ncbi:MAG: stage III sporulation protein AD [Clostridia bacterium]|nr:stage III sporulation protein AD [Clostridia bacterium]
MDEIIKIIGMGLISLIIIIIIKQYKPEFAIYISIIAGVLILFLIMDKLEGIINLLKTISAKSGINNQFLELLLKITGIAFLTEFAINLCKDSGENAIASKIEIGSKVIIVSMSIPIISSLLEVILKLI